MEALKIKYLEKLRADFSNPDLATEEETSENISEVFLFSIVSFIDNERLSLKSEFTFLVRYTLFLVSITKPSGNITSCILCFAVKLSKAQYLLMFLTTSIDKLM